MTVKTRQERREKRKKRVRRKLWGTPERPRLSIAKTNHHLYVQVIDDVSQLKGSKSLLQMTTNSKEFKNDADTRNFCTIEYAKRLGEKAGEALKEKGMVHVAFDRSGYQYHGLVKALAETIREQGIKF